MSKGLSPVVLNRLRPLVESFAGSQAMLAKEAGMSPAALSQMMRGESQPNATKMAKLAEALGSSLDQILLGAVPVAATNETRFQVPFHDISVSAGTGLVALEHQEPDAFWPFPIEALAELTDAPELLNMLPVRGDSMAPTLNDGDWIMIDRSRRDWVDGIYVARFHEDLFVKRVQFEGREIRLASDNANYRTISIAREDEADVQAFELLGRVIWKAGAV